MTERLHFHFLLSCIGEGNGNPFQCSCLENPRDEEPGGLPSTWSHRVGHDSSDLAAIKIKERKQIPEVFEGKEMNMLTQALRRKSSFYFKESCCLQFQKLGYPF